MAAAIVVGVSTGAMKPVLEKLATLMGDEFSKVKNVRKDVKFLTAELTNMNIFLESLEAVEELDLQTKHRRNEVRNMSYDIENIIDDFMQKIGEKNEKDWLGTKTIRFIKTSRARHQIAGQIKEIKKLVCETSERHKRYEFNTHPSSDVTTDPRDDIPQQDAASLVGVEVTTNELINWLNDEETHLKVASIVGFGGMGKTTLANKIYRQPEGGFQCCAFASVTLKHDIPKLIRSLLSELGSDACSHDCELHVLVGKLRDCLQQKRYLIVIDDLWKKLPWEIIKDAFPDNCLRSRVITTTRIHDVADACCSGPHDYIVKMKPLSDEDSRRLFFNKIFMSEKDCPVQLRNVCTEILRKCDGMPLAIITLSGMLASEPFDKAEWERIRDSLGSGTNFTLRRMRKILALSYKNLPRHLKTCLLYLGMYPEDFKIQRHHLELQWIAEGFISKENGQDVGKVARSYFDELVNRNLIEPFEYDDYGMVTHCKVHDTIRDLILSKCAEENFLTIVDDPQAMTKLDCTVHRLSLQLNCPADPRMLPGNSTSLSQVRTFMIFGWLDHMPPLSLFKFLRVLYVRGDLLLRDSDIIGDPNRAALAKMYQLRYLAIMGYGMTLPTHIRGLRHLETIDVCHTYKLPSDIVRLERLMFLNVNWCTHKLPDGIGNMKSLQNVEEFDLMGHSLDNIEDLGELISLRILQVHCGRTDVINNRKTRMDALCSSLGKICTSLERLGLHIEGCIDVLMNLSTPPCRLERFSTGDVYTIRPPPEHIGRYLGPIWREVPKTFLSRVPNWMRELINLKRLEIHVLKADVGILAELPALVFLRLYIIENVRERIVIGARAFPVLKCFELRLSSASYLSFLAGAMPKLRWLSLQFCGLGWNRNVPGPAGLHHLSALEDFVAIIETNRRTECSEAIAVSALENAIDMHPSHPRVHIACLNHSYSVLEAPSHSIDQREPGC